MAEEEKQEQETADEQAPEEEAAADATVPEEQAEEPAADADEAAEEELEGAPAEEPAAEAAEPTEEEPEEVLSPKQLRKRERSRASGPAGPQRSAEPDDEWSAARCCGQGHRSHLLDRNGIHR